MARDPDFADGLSGGPDYWDVTNLSSGGTLNVRAGPATGDDIIGALAKGDTVRNLGCAMVGDPRWCRIEANLERRITGWASGRYKPVGTDPGFGLSFERLGDLTLIRIGDGERYEIPDALVFGG